MADDMRSNLHRAFDDLTDGMESLLGFGRSSPNLVTELLGERGESRQSPLDATGRRPHHASPRTPRRSRARRRSRTHLTLVK